jgi:glutamate formiminotransferase / formiminotetrahydrofolate cyclodeaminase
VIKLDRIVECVPNFSEGKDKAIINAITAAIRSVEDVKVLNVDAGADFNRTVYTFVGSPDDVLEAAFQAAKVGTALIDMRKHKGEHARMGALDVMPFIPIKGVSDDDCISLSKQFGKRMADELNIPVFLYAKSASKPDREKLPQIRKGEYEALEEKFKDPSFIPDFGKPEFVPKSGATATGCRDILLAYNINLDTGDKNVASKIAGVMRTSGTVKKDKNGEKIIGPDGKAERTPGKFKGVQAGGMMYDENTAQVSMNLLNYREVNLHDVYEAVKEEAEQYDVAVTGSEIVGLVPMDSLIIAGRFYAKKLRENYTDEDDLVSLAINHLGLSDLYEFNADEKIIEYMIEEKGALAHSTVSCFLSELASSSPAPGGGSVAALSGALAAALDSMVCQLTIGKKKYEHVQEDISQLDQQLRTLQKRLIELIDDDTNAFNDVMAAFKMPKETEEQKKKRSESIQNGYRKAAEIPMETARIAKKVLHYSIDVAKKGNTNSITDAGVAGLLGYAAVHAASLNVRINLGSIKDERFVKKISKELMILCDEADHDRTEVEIIVKENM